MINNFRQMQRNYKMEKELERKRAFIFKIAKEYTAARGSNQARNHIIPEAVPVFF